MSKIKKLKAKEGISNGEALFNILNMEIIEQQAEIESLKAQVDSKWISVDTPEDVETVEEILCWDGCDFSIDYVDLDADSGAHYMANGTEIIAYKLLNAPNENNHG